MGLCTLCDQPVPFGGRKTIRNAVHLGQLAYELDRRLLKDASAESIKFVDEGWRHHKAFHEYGHHFTDTPPDWTAAGIWRVQAEGLVRRLQ